MIAFAFLPSRVFCSASSVSRLRPLPRHICSLPDTHTTHYGHAATRPHRTVTARGRRGGGFGSITIILIVGARLSQRAGTAALTRRLARCSVCARRPAHSRCRASSWTGKRVRPSSLGGLAPYSRLRTPNNGWKLRQHWSPFTPPSLCLGPTTSTVCYPPKQRYSWT